MAGGGGCVVCGQPRLRSQWIVDGYPLVRCAHCTAIFVRPMPTIAELDAFYQRSPADIAYRDDANVENLAHYDRQLKARILRIHGSGRCLDVGCSSGRFLRHMQPQFEVHGVEISRRDAALAAAVPGARVHCGTLEGFAAPAGSFDVVTFLDTLDHCPDPRADVARAARLLKAGGLLVIKVHDVGCAWARIAGRGFYAISPPGHLVYFNQRSLRLLLESVGLEWRGHEHIGHRLSLKVIAYRLSRGKTESVAFRMYEWLARSRVGRWTMRKNLRDIVTVFARKPMPALELRDAGRKATRAR